MPARATRPRPSNRVRAAIDPSTDAGRTQTGAADCRAFWIAAPGRGEIRDEALPAPGPGQLRVRTLYTAISRGTETRVFRGEIPASERASMRAPFQVGDFGGPLKYGYSNVGVVEDGPADWAGRRVFCLFPHQTRYVVDADRVVPLPDGLDPGRAVLAANMETAVNACWDLGAGVGDRIAVVGAGVVGLLVATLLARLPGVAVELVDVDPGRARAAAALGLRLVGPEAARPEADRVVHASGQPAGLVTALRLAGLEATVLELSWYGTQAVTLPLGEAFHSRRLVLRSSQVGRIPAAQQARWTHRRRIALALDLLADPALDALIDAQSAFASLPATMAAIADPTDPASRVLCHRIRYD